MDVKILVLYVQYVCINNVHPQRTQPFDVCIILRTKAANLCHACPRRHAEMFPWHAPFTVVWYILIPFARPVSLCCEERERERENCVYIYIRFIAKKLLTACSRSICKIVPVTNLNLYLYYDSSETEVNIHINVNISSENSTEKNTATSGWLIIAAFDFVVHLYISCTCVRSATE